jgi:hypothetical protein
MYLQTFHSYGPMPLLIQSALWVIRLFFGALCMGFVSAVAAQSAAQTVDRIKAAYVFNFAKFVELPSAEDKLIRLCVFGRDDLNGTILSLNRRMAQGREIVVRKDVALDQLKECSMVFVSEDHVRQLPAVVRQLNNTPVLLVGDGRRAVDHGAHLALLFSDDRVEFDVNLQNLQKSNIRASSQMLKLARTVIR